MTDQQPVYDSVRLNAGAYEIRTYHKKRVRVIKQDGKWVIAIPNNGKWLYNSKHAFEQKATAMDIAKQLLEKLIKESPSKGNDGNGQKNTGIDPNNLSRNDALELLGFGKDTKPSKDEISAAHRKWALKVHPDNGGNTAMMALLNNAKDVLLP